ncbi:bacterioferritin [Erythrobacter sp. LQ02-29]|uniref:bacterioferritin n=1 Tax=Erythrobacter sp. LQ02-29 TaxID=2920384 RepID=UPI001F4DA6FA|nr:bacterioferritin [Erythrobacter sp. LQ02-29]MCP9223095.1 bacterioferritin [Erythrobacter sp. LQ02-29]
MKGDAKVIQYLNQALTNELTATNQYWLHFRMLDHWGMTWLAQYERKESIEEMVHADHLTARILLLDGHPNFQRLGNVRVGETVEEVIQADLELEEEAIPLLRDAIEHCESVRDYVSRDLLKEILRDEEDHVDHLETQQEMIEKMGLQNYIQLQSAPAPEQHIGGATAGDTKGFGKGN